MNLSMNERFIFIQKNKTIYNLLRFELLLKLHEEYLVFKILVDISILRCVLYAPLFVMLILKGQNGQKKSRSLLVSTLSLLLSTRQIHDNLSFKLPQPFNTGHLL